MTTVGPTAPLTGVMSSTGATPAPPSSRANASKQAAQLLESLFVRTLVRALGKDSAQSALFGKSLGRGIYQEMFQGALADKISEAGGLGLAQQLEAQLSGKAPASVAPRSQSLPLGSALRTPPAARATTSTTIARSAATVATPPVAARPRALALAAKVALQRGRQVLAAGGHDLGGVSYAAPTRPSAGLPRDADSQLRPPLGGVLGAQGSWQGKAGGVVSAVASGRVVSVAADGLVLEHAGGRRTHYQGLAKVEAQVGDLVLRGQQLGRLLATGKLDFALQERGVSVEASKMKRLFAGARNR